MIDLDTSEVVDTLRLDEKALSGLYMNLDKRGGGIKRDGSGFRTKPTPCILGLVCTDTQLRPYRVAVREIGSTSCIVLVGMYTHPGQECTITIPTASGEQQFFEAMIKECVHVMGKYHEMLLEIDTKIEIIEFIGSGPVVTKSSNSPTQNDEKAAAYVDARIQEIETILEAASSLGAGDTNAACRQLLQILLSAAERNAFKELSKVTQKALESCSDNIVNPATLASIDAALQTLRSE